MKVNVSYWDLALALRGFIISEYLKYHGPTDAKAGVSLVHYAFKYNFSDRTRPIPGKTLRDWLKNGVAPQWAIKSMVCYILEHGFIPNNDDELIAIIVYLVIDENEDNIFDIKNMHLLKGLDSEEINNIFKKIRHAESF